MTYTATYSPEDNKIRLSASSRLDSETYARVKAAGFIWAPKQQIFVAPMWTPEREDLALELAGEIEDEDKSLVERAEERAERFEDYSDSRRQDAEAAHKAVHAIADNIPFGQPILVGHHSERRARKDAEKIENGMRRAVKMWETAQYWKSRAAGAIRAAKYKELPAVRARRIKGLEADKRREERYIAEAEKFTRIWSASLEWDPEVRRLTREQARQIANYDHVCSGMCFPLKDYPRNPPASQYEGAMGLWSALGDTDEQAIITPEQARDFALKGHARTIARATRWLQHTNNRLEYERAMLAEAGGTAADKFDIQVGGQVQRRGEWFVVTKLNKRDGALNSVTVIGHWCTTIPVGDIQNYQPPAEGDTEKTQAAMKRGPLCNYPGEGFAHITTAQWDAVHKDYRGSRDRAATETTGKHRVRVAIGYRVLADENDQNRRHSYVPCFITDQKRKDPPALTKEAPVALPARIIEPPARVTRKAQSLDDVQDAMFYHYDSGKPKCGIKYEYSGEGESECYQYNTVAELVEEARALEAQPRILRYSIVTHSGEYKNMATVYKWERSAEIFEALKDGLSKGVQVVSAPQLFPTPADLAERMTQEADIRPGNDVLEPSAGTGRILDACFHLNGFGWNHQPEGGKLVAVEINGFLADNLKATYPTAIVRRADFLECNGDLGKFDRILMNPPFANGADIKHIQHAVKFLKPGGRLVAICAGGPRQKEALEPLAALWEPLPPDTFKESGTGVNAVLLTIEA